MNSKGKCIITVIALFSIIFLSFSILCLPAFGDDGSKPKNPWEVWDYLGKPVKGGEYRVAAFKDVGLLNPHHWPINNWDVIDYLFDQYISSAEGNKMVPWMMESWEYLDNLTVVMKLKKGIVFHDGTAFNAGAVKYNVEWVMDKTNGCWDRSYFEPVDSVEILDDYTLKFKFKKSYGAFLAILSYPPGYALSVASLKGDLEVREFQRLERKLKLAKKKAAKLEKKAKKAASKDAAQGKKANAKFKKAKKTLTKLEKKFSEKSKKMKGIKSTDTFPVGSNAYMYDDRSPGNWIKLKRNPNWWYGKTVGKPDLPYFDSIKAIVIPDSSIQLANLKTGRIHQMKLSPFQYKLLRRSPHPAIKMGVINAAITTMLSFNHAKGPCKNILVRKAISHAIDRKALIHGALFGLARPASCLYPSDQGSHNPDLMPVSYDPEKSRALLKEAGYPNGFKTKLFGNTRGRQGDFYAAIQQGFKEVGIEAEIEFMDAGKYWFTILKGWKNGLVVFAQNSPVNLNLQLNGLYQKDSARFVCLDRPLELQEILTKAEKVTDYDSQAPLIQEAVRMLHDKAVVVPLWTWSVVNATSTKLHDHGYSTANRGQWEPADAWLSK